MDPSGWNVGHQMDFSPPLLHTSYSVDCEFCADNVLLFYRISIFTHMSQHLQDKIWHCGQMAQIFIWGFMGP